MSNLITKLLCKHEESYTVTNLYGDCINTFSKRNETIRSIRKCKKCGKIIYSPYLDENCNTINFYLNKN